MTHRHPFAIVAGAATIMAAVPLTTVFSQFTWMVYALLGVALQVAVAIGVRTLRGPVYAQALAMVAVLLLYLTFLFPSGGEFLRLIPTAETFRHFNDLFVAAGQDVRNEAVPVPDRDGLLLLATAGVCLVGIMVDFLAIGIRRPALAGLPMLAIYSVPVAVLPGSLSIFPFIFSAAGFLWLLVTDSVDRVRRFGRRFTGDGRDVDMWEPSPLSAAGRRLGVVGLVLAMLLPLAVPGMTSGLLDRFGNGGTPGDGTGPGSGQAVDLFALLNGNLTQDRAFDMVRVTTDDPSPYYLRFGVADSVTKDGFVNQAATGDLPVNRGLPDYPVPAVLGVTGERFRAQVQVLNLDMQLAPLYQQVLGTPGLDGSWYFDSGTNEVFSRRSNINKKTYTVDYLRLSYTTAGLRRARPIQDTDFGARQLTTVPANPEVTALVAGLIQGKSTQYDRVRAIYEHFSPNNGFQYTTRTEPGDSGSAIVDFLRSKKGFCVQYAAAMAWLVRAAGIPARVAFGFTRGRSTVSGTYTMSNLNLHAWTEVFFSGIGWVPFDATPTGPVTGSAPTLWAPDLTLPNPDDSGPLPSETAPDDRPTNRPSEDAGGGNDNPVSPGGTTPAVNTWWLISAAVVVAVVFLLLAPAMRRRALRRARRTRSGRLIVIGADSSAGAVPAADPVEVTGDPAAVMVAREDAHAAWAELLDTMVDFEVPVDPAETPRATAERLSTLPALRPAGRAHTDLLAKAEERARYARTPLRPDRLDEAVSATRKAFALRASRRQRLSATLLPRSVIQRWRAAWLGRLARLVTVTGQVRDAAMSLSPRRLLTGRRATRWPSGWKP